MSTPSSPQNVRGSSFRGSTYLKIRWNAPIYNADCVTHYKVIYRKVDSTYLHVQETKRKEKLSAVVRGLDSNTDYLFSVQSVNGKKDGGCSETILLDTRWSKAAKVTATPGVVVGTTLATPFVGGAAAAVAVWDKIEPQNPVTGLLTSVLSIGAGLLAGAASVVIAPVVGVAAARELHDEKCHSPQSPEER